MYRKPLAQSIAAATLLLSLPSYASTDLFFSEYIEGSSFNKAFEIANNTGDAVDLSTYSINVYSNGSPDVSASYDLSGNLASGSVFVFAHSNADPLILDLADQTTGGNMPNGDDAVALVNNGELIDVIGQIGFDPGSRWGSDLSSTQNNTLRRKSSVVDGDTNGADVFDPALEWDGFGNDVFDGLGSFEANNQPAVVLINEVDADTPSTDILEFIELYDGGRGNTALDGYRIVLFNGSDTQSYNDSFSLDGQTTNAEGYFVLGNSAVANVNMVIKSNGIQNGADAVALYLGSTETFPNDTPITLDNLVDAIVYDTNDNDNAGLLILVNPGQPQVNEAETSSPDESNQRCENGSGGLRNTDSYIQAAPTPGASNSCAPPAPPVVISECGDPATAISAVQGSGNASPLAGTRVSVEAVVVGDFRGDDALSGFFLQEEDSDHDADPASSEGIFVYEGTEGIALSIGDVVHLSGDVSEFNDLTELSNIAGLQVCSSGADYTPSQVTLPVASLDELEQVEGMAVQFWQSLSVTETYSLGRFGELGLAANGRLMNPTQVATPGVAAQELGDANDLRRILLDDGRTSQNPAVVPYPAPGLSADNPVRVGDSVASISGVMSYGFGAYRIHPTSAPVITPTNMRAAAPSLPGTGSLTVASFNVLNYFNGASGFPTARGADTASEFVRQRAKIISALVAMDADIVGLVEIENNGYGSDGAIQDLVNGLSDAGLNYSFVDPGLSTIGTDAIAVGFIYKTDTVTTQGASAILDSSVDPDFIDTKNRPALAQTFSEVAGGGTLTIAVNHFKSKGSNCNSIGDPDLGDGQGNCNLTRTQAASSLVNWLSTDPTGSGDEDVLVIGDLNAYAMEDPISAIKNAGYTNLVSALSGENAYSYVFAGESGNLDHALSSPTLTNQVSGITEWHINADEAVILDYNEEFKSDDQLVKYYNDGPYRASDHDPLIIELSLTVPVAGDFNGDGIVNQADFKLLQAQLNTDVTEATEMFDLNLDGRITGQDVAAFKELRKEAREADKEAREADKELRKEAREAEKELEKEAREAEKELRKEAREAEKEAREAEKEAREAEKELEKEAREAEKELRKEAREAEKEASSAE